MKAILILCAGGIAAAAPFQRPEAAADTDADVQPFSDASVTAMVCNREL